jgi:hypothetical protein
MPIKLSRSPQFDGNFEAIARREVPRDRKGKHHEIVTQILHDVRSLKPTSALRVPRSRLGDVKIEHVRAALGRAAAKAGLSLSSRADENFLYVWPADRD